MQQLTGLDAAFLALETANSTGHVGGVCILDPTGAPAPLTLARLTEMFAARLPLVPVLRRRLLTVPLGLDQPYWVDDPNFDIEYHVREIALPRPGSMAQLTEQVSRLHARPLDRSRPLWEIYLITGLAKRRAAVYTKIHHAAVDGVSGTELLTVLAPAMNALVGGMLGLNRGDGAVIATWTGPAPATPFNRPITAHRRF